MSELTEIPCKLHYDDEVANIYIVKVPSQSNYRESYTVDGVIIDVDEDGFLIGIQLIYDIPKLRHAKTPSTNNTITESNLK